MVFDTDFQGIGFGFINTSSFLTKFLNPLEEASGKSSTVPITYVSTSHVSSDPRILLHFIALIDIRSNTIMILALQNFSVGNKFVYAVEVTYVIISTQQRRILYYRE